MADIKFGTDGWRAIIGDRYTFDNLTLVSQATAQWLHNNYGPSPVVVIGYDTRFMGNAFARHSARVLATYGIRVHFARGGATTPAISWITLDHRFDAGVVITASHNPPEYNGFKIKANFGGPASPKMIAAIEDELTRLETPARPLLDFDLAVEQGLISLLEVNARYLEMIRSKIDIEAIQASGIWVAHDAMFGASQGKIAELLGPERVVELHNDFNPGFHGQAPEPIEKNLKELSELIVREQCAVGIANDGDADRVGMYDENGQFVDSHQIMALLVKYLHTRRGMRGDIVKTFSTTHMLDRMGKTYGMNVHTLPIGFKYIGSLIVEGDVLVGGEESGGMAVKGHIPERDGIYIGLLVVEMMVKRNKKLSDLVLELFDEFGPHYNRRKDIHTTNEKKQAALDLLAARKVDSIAGQPVRTYETLDGFKMLMDEGWLLVRASGTEPVLRVYSESATPEQAFANIDDVIARLGV